MELTSLVEQVPGLAVLVGVVFQFLRHMERSAHDFKAHYATLSQSFADALKDHSKVVEHLSEEIKSSKEVSAKLAQIVMFHDATVKGESAETLGSSQDFMKKILG